jgi:hypothetical protein
MEDHRHCDCGRAIQPTAKACPECFVQAVAAELDRLNAQAGEGFVRAHTMVQRRHAAQQALALVVAGMDDDPPAQLLSEVDDVALVVSSLVGLTTGLLRNLDERRPGTAANFLHGIGLSFEWMAEGKA